MLATHPTERVDSLCHGIRCAAWLTLPGGQEPRQAVVLAHGLGATHDMMLARYEQHFAGAPIATLAFDYRNTGASDG
jgi:pimeloyl-ACP methyl ester carboxylesterase